MINNDTIMQDQNFIQKIIEEYAREPYHILGPKNYIFSQPKKYEPGASHSKSIEEVKRNIFRLRILLLSNYLRLEGFLRNIKKNIN